MASSRLTRFSPIAFSTTRGGGMILRQAGQAAGRGVGSWGQQLHTRRHTHVRACKPSTTNQAHLVDTTTLTTLSSLAGVHGEGVDVPRLLLFDRTQNRTILVENQTTD